MTSGIYALYWEEPSLVYIGRAVDINRRFNRHLKSLSLQNHYNYKLQNTFNKYGIPKLVLIEQSTIDLLADKELYWIKEFNSVKDGLNITSGGDGAGYGVNNSFSKYSKITILKVFSYLYKTTKSFKYIASKLNVPVTLCRDIGEESRHLWLKDLYPIQYEKLISNKSIRINSNSIVHRYGSVTLLSPTGTKYTVTNIKEFAKIHKLNPGNISSLISKRYNSSKGWTLVQELN